MIEISNYKRESPNPNRPTAIPFRRGDLSGIRTHCKASDNICIAQK